MFSAAQLGSVSARPYSGTAYRHQSPGYDPRSGEGARLHGGRFNPPDSFPVLYLCETRPCAVAEFTRLGTRNAIGVAALLPRDLYAYSMRLSRVLDLSSDAVLAQLDLTPDTVTSGDWTVTQEVGSSAHRLGWQALLSPSATGQDRILAVLPELIGAGPIGPSLAERWQSVEDL